MNTSEQVNEELNDSQGLGERVRDHLPVGLVTLERRARQQWIALPAQVRTALDDVVARVRKTLDLPSRAEVNDLVTRIEELDRKLAELEATRAAKEAKATKAKAAKAKPAKASKAKTAKPKTKPKKTAGKASRRDAIKKAATRKRS